MNDHAVRLLDFEVIRRELLDYAWSEDGKKKIAEETFRTSRAELEKLRGPVKEFRRLLETSEDAPSLSFPDVAEAVRLSEKPGALLEAVELALIGSYLRQARTLKAFLSRGEKLLRNEAEDLPDLSDLAARIGKIVDPEGNIRDNDIPSLAGIRRRIRSIRRDLDGLAGSYLSGSDFRGYWQSDTASQKDGRLVLPLNANFKGRIKGVVHEISSRGATAFFEPLDIFEKNNELVEEENEYRMEVFRILRELTAAVGSRAGELRFLMDRIGVIDSWQVRARHSRRHDCFTVEFADEGLAVFDARHPLLGKKAVPIDVEFREGTRILIITGPNTGGKTVALKTLGLLALMNQFGLDLPVRQGSRLPVFDEVYVDIGDEQSIAESLSTFSAHVRNLGSVVKACSPRSLVLLDELGSGTDPEQGAALAMSFLDSLLRRGCLALVTTHLGVLKHYAFTKEGVSNASVDFDLDLLKPTYRILPGIPGASHALEIAERHGVPPEIIAAAKEYVDRNETDSAKLIRSLIDRERELAARSRELDRLREEVVRRDENLAEKEQTLLAKESELRREGLTDLNRFLAESRQEIELLVRRIREGQAGRESRRQVRTFVEKVKERAAEEQEELHRHKPRVKAHPPPQGPLEPGMEVFVGANRRRGVLDRKLRNGKWQVSAGAVRITVGEEDLFPAGPSKRNVEVQISLNEPQGGEPAKLELDLRGMRAEEALAALGKQIDRALLQGLFEFGVVHGKGEGILQNAVGEYLRGCPAVADFSFALPEAGGTGKTFVRLKR